METELGRNRQVSRIPVNEVWGAAKKGALDISIGTAGRIGVLDMFANSVAYRLPRVVEVQGLTPQFTDRFLDLTRQGMVPEIVVGHFSHLDHVVISHFCQSLLDLATSQGLGNNLNGFVETLALSVPQGQQSKFMQRMYSKMEEYANARGVEFIPITRNVDMERYGMPKVVSEARPLVTKLRQKGVGLLVSPGGSVQPGRHPKGASRDQIFGLQEIKDESILSSFDLMERSGKRFDQQPYFLPVAVNRTYKVFNPDNLLPTPEGLISLYDKLSWFFSLVGFKRIEITITPANPQTTEDLKSRFGSEWRKYPKEVTDFLMTEVARNLSPNARGYYGKFI